MEYRSEYDEFLENEAYIKLEEANIQENGYENEMEKNAYVGTEKFGEKVKCEDVTIKSETEVEFEKENNDFNGINEDCGAQMLKCEEITIKSEMEESYNRYVSFYLINIPSIFYCLHGD